ncbi:MAG TPA: hypothetical protein VFT04_12495 [Gemmatimonadales bacterium]|nr:hypothetical protein [Gemmatimonadales bacterium]
MLRRRLLAAIALLAATAGAADAQFFEFGQNKIQYRRFDWRVLKGEHVDLYYYPAEETLAHTALAYAEESYDSLAIRFGHEVPARIPLIVYASHVDFEQTNILPFVPPEGLLGATDFLKRRVTMPFRGNLAEFRHTLRHELVHVFQLSLIAESYNSAPRGSRPVLPLWWTEGLAELWSGGEDARDEMILRDLTLTGRLPPIGQLEYVSSFVVYPLGGRIHRWLADTYGDWRVALMYRELSRYESFEAAVEAIYGRKLSELSDEFLYAMRRAYYPSVETRAPPSLAGRELERLAIKPAFLAGSAGGDEPGEIVYLSPRTGYLTVYRRALEEEGRERSVVASGRSEAIESFHAFDSRIDASRPGFLLLSARHHDRDALLVWDMARRRAAGRYQFDGLVSVLSPRWMPDGQSVVFSGLSESGLSDLYRVQLPGGELERLTNDPFQDLDPAPSPDGRTVVFASDRGEAGRKGAMNLFRLDLAALRTEPLTRGEWVDETPAWGPDGRVYFTSNRDTVLNVFSVDTLGNGRRETSVWTGAYDADPLPDGSGLVLGGFQGASYNIYRAPFDTVAQRQTFTLDRSAPDPGWAWAVPRDSVTGGADDAPYRRRLTLDFAAGGVTVTPGYGGAQGVAALLSDLLGDHLLFASIGSVQGRDLGSFFENLNATAIYLNQTRRVNWGIGAFRAAGRVFEGDLEPSFTERSAGAIGLIRYPLSRFSRIEATGVIEHSDRFDFALPDPETDDLKRVGWIGSNYVSYVRDNSLWIPSGPIDGTRLALTAGLSSDFSNARFDSFLLSGDLRSYLRLGRRSTFASRLYGFYSGGDRPRRVNIGGSVGLRGYPNFGHIIGSRAWMANHELRFPLLNRLVFGTPFGDVVFPEFQGAFFGDVGRAWFGSGSTRPTIGSYGGSIRLALAPLAVLRLDIGRRFGADDLVGYSLDPDDRDPGFISFFFGYNY